MSFLRRYYPALLVLLTLTNMPFIYAANGISLGVGNGTRDVHNYRISLQRDWANDKITYNNHRLTGYWELAFTKITSSRWYTQLTNSTDAAIAASIVLRMPFYAVLNWFADIGIGVAYMQHRDVAMRDLGSNVLFEDKLGLGVLCGKKKQIEFGYKFVHYSNAYLAQKNQGLNLHFIMLGYWFN